MSALPYMPLYVADYLADAAHLTTEEHGAYLLLIMTYWQRGKALPADPAKLARIVRMSNERWTDVEQTLNEFFTVIDGHWHHKRIDAELEKVRDKTEKAKRAGAASGSARRAASAQQTFNECSTDAEQTPNHTDTDTDTDTVCVKEAHTHTEEFSQNGIVEELLSGHAADLTDWEQKFLISIKWADSISKTQFETLKGIQGKVAPKTNGPRELLSVKRGTPGYDAWIARYRRQSKTGKTFHETLDALTVPTEFPPAEVAA